MKRSLVFFQIVVILLFILLLIYNLREVSFKESFGTIFPSRPSDEALDVWDIQISSTSVYDKTPTHLCDTLRYASKYLGDSDDVFQIRYCLEKEINTETLDEQHQTVLDSMIGSLDMYTQTIVKDTFDMKMIRRDIERALFNFKQGRKVQGPVFAIVTQAPYYIDDNGVTIYQQPFNKLEYRLSPTLPHKYLPADGIRLIVHLLFPMYNRNKEQIGLTTEQDRENAVKAEFSDSKIREIVTALSTDPSGRYSTEESIKAEVERRIRMFIDNYVVNDFKTHILSRLLPIQNHRSTSSMCKIHCIGDKGLLCGCMNQNTPYESRCMGKTTVQDNQNTDYHDYMMFYRINERSEKIRRYFTDLYYEDVAL